MFIEQATGLDLINTFTIVSYDRGMVNSTGACTIKHYGFVMARFRSKLVPFILLVTNTLA
jgi:hypothetical protein